MGGVKILEVECMQQQLDCHVVCVWSGGRERAKLREGGEARRVSLQDREPGRVLPCLALGRLDLDWMHESSYCSARLLQEEPVHEH